MISCGQACPYNTLNGCKVKEYNGICPLTNMAPADMEAVKAAKPQTNADRIRAMSDEELSAIILCTKQFDMNATCYRMTCHQCALNWLKQPVKDGDNDG